MKLTYEELTRLIGYIAGIAAGLGFIVFGLVNGDLPTALAGAGMLGLGGVAGLNINKTQSVASSADDFEEVPLGQESTVQDVDFEDSSLTGQVIATAGSKPGKHR